MSLFIVCLAPGDMIISLSVSHCSNARSLLASFLGKGILLGTESICICKVRSTWGFRHPSDEYPYINNAVPLEIMPVLRLPPRKTPIFGPPLHQVQTSTPYFWYLFVFYFLFFLA